MKFLNWKGEKKWTREKKKAGREIELTAIDFCYLTADVCQVFCSTIKLLPKWKRNRTYGFAQKCKISIDLLWFSKKKKKFFFLVIFLFLVFFFAKILFFIFLIIWWIIVVVAFAYADTDSTATATVLQLLLQLLLQ